MKVLLIGEKSFIVETEQKNFNNKYGKFDLAKIKIGKKIKSSLGKEFMAVKPTIIDLLHKCSRGPQVVTPKDAAQVVAVTGVTKGWKCLDAGAGSGFLSLFLGNIVGPEGKVTGYEKEKRHYEIVKKNINFCSAENVKVKNKDILKGFTEKKLDLVTLDMKSAEKMVAKVSKALNYGGWLVVYSPHIEQQREVRDKMKNSGFTSIKTIENIQRSWTTDYGFSHPKYQGLMHTGFLTFGRKF